MNLFFPHQELEHVFFFFFFFFGVSFVRRLPRQGGQAFFVAASGQRFGAQAGAFSLWIVEHMAHPKATAPVLFGVFLLCLKDLKTSKKRNTGSWRI